MLPTPDYGNFITVVYIVILYLYDYGSNSAKMLILSAGDDAVVPRVSRV